MCTVSDFDLVVRGGLVVDGSGADPFTADVGIRDGRIAAVGRVSGRGAREIDADGLVVTPGFIDGHTHLDAQLFWDKLGTNSCWHGVTTAVMGNCGFSIAPVRLGEKALVQRNLERAEDISREAMDKGINWSWEGFDQFLDVVDGLDKGINYAAYVGHSALRTWAMGERAYGERATESDLALMSEELRRAMNAGAIGLSTSRGGHETSDDRPVASRSADWDELRHLLGVMKGRKGAMFGIANEYSSRDPESLDRYYRQLGDVTLEAGVTTTFGLMSPNWRRIMDSVEDSNRRGGRMVVQSHSRGATVLISFKSQLPFDNLPVWKEFRQLPLDEQKAGLRDPAMRARLSDAVHNAVYGRAIGAEARAPDWDEMLIYDKPLPPYRSVGDVARERGCKPLDVLIDESLAHDFNLFFIQPVMILKPDDMVPLMKHPNSVMTFSDSGAHVSQIADASIQSHFIAYWHREKKLFTLPEAVNLISGRVADVWNFQDRGRIREGNVADLNIFDLETFGPAMPEVAYDIPGGARRLAQRSVGMKATIIAGQILIEDGEHTGVYSGQLLRRRD